MCNGKLVAALVYENSRFMSTGIIVPGQGG